MDNIRAYGAGLAGGQFDANAFFKKPTVIFRTIALNVSSALTGIEVLRYILFKVGGYTLQEMEFLQFYFSPVNTCLNDNPVWAA
ncbi:hypothetical protein ANCCEY_01983 [Ancylostoma ceylanicum]|uniref:Uncharacterized protein n=1 Tax=Ancylostoma ceylanicum TaxID=53326 RepID=A0A0D6M466_9BILA|nr:hypothetical protein ANCCEY_01983 [Ancylostoma ceylanicum]